MHYEYVYTAHANQKVCRLWCYTVSFLLVEHQLYLNHFSLLSLLLAERSLQLCLSQRSRLSQHKHAPPASLTLLIIHNTTCLGCETNDTVLFILTNRSRCVLEHRLIANHVCQVAKLTTQKLALVTKETTASITLACEASIACLCLCSSMNWVCLSDTRFRNTNYLADGSLDNQLGL